MKIIDNDVVKEITPEILAELFADLGSDGQVAFFNHLAHVSDQWSSPFCIQMQWVTEDVGLTYPGRRVMQTIGEYSHWGLSCRLADEVKAAS